MRIKRCNRCRKTKSINKFHKNKNKKDGFNIWCKNCMEKYGKKRYKENSEKIKIINNKWNKNNPEIMKEIQRKWKENNPEYYKKYYKDNPRKAKKWERNNPEKLKESRKKYRKKSDLIPKNKLSDRISALMRYSLKGNKNGNHWENLVGYTLQDLMTHLKSLFKIGMNWNNYGKNGWEIDHIKPISSFNFKSYEDKSFKKCWELDNLQPLWASENRFKSNKI